jgi:hypothetical protein
MHTRQVRILRASCFCVLTTVFAVSVESSAQQPVPTTKTYIKLGEDFLHALYPDLNDKKYTITVETTFRYDDPTDIPRVFTLDVGAGPKSFVIACCFGGSVGGVLPFKFPDPLEWGPPSPPPCPPAPVCPLFSTPRTPIHMKNVDAEGRLRPEQFLTGSFSFDVKGRLVAFNAQGSATANHEADNQLYDALRSRPGLTEAEIMKAVKESGAKYGFRDEAQFREGLPIKEIERFVGKLEILSLTFNPINNSWNDDPVNKLGVWGSVEVLMRATHKDGTRFSYRAFFDHFGGALGGLYELPKTPAETKK